MQNRNILWFTLGTLILLGAQWFVTSRYAPVAPSINNPAPTITRTEPITPPTPMAVAKPTRGLSPGYTVTISNPDIDVSFRKDTGALVQVKWLRDGTLFFPHQTSPGTEGFIGLGESSRVFTDHRAEVKASGTAIDFYNDQGDHLVWTVPTQGYILEIQATSATPQTLTLIPMPETIGPVANLGRVFSIEETKVHETQWSKILTDPFFGFLGAQRSTLPSAAQRVGLDAGLETGNKAQSSHYFVAVWKSPTAPISGSPFGYTVQTAPTPLTLQLYAGPKELNALSLFDNPSSQAVSFGFFGTIAKWMFYILKAIHTQVGNWGWSIVVFTLILRGLLWWPNTKQTISMLRMKDFEPHQKSIQSKYEKYGNDMSKKAEMQRELMDLYKKNNHSPFGGCLPMLLQMPVLFSLWSMLQAVFELRNAPFIGWIHNLSGKDPYYVLPVLMGLGMIVQTAMTPAMGDPQQRKIMMFMMPVMMVFIFAQSPAGLCLYYTVFTLIGLGQTWWVKRNYVSQPIKV
ncbi:hypothetical protein LBMAG01_01170 [Acidobacteriota bacterium]|nr:hypothetical protein LBMAG01_01170 [Acidobacteriota bacterium]